MNDSDWGTLTVKNVSGPGGSNANEEHWTGTRVFRRWIQIPEKINGYATQGSRVSIDLRFGSPGSLMITVFSNGAILYRGSDDDILPDAFDRECAARPEVSDRGAGGRGRRCAIGILSQRTHDRAAAHATGSSVSADGTSCRPPDHRCL